MCAVCFLKKEMKMNHLNFKPFLPKTGQTIVYNNFDDGFHKRGFLGKNENRWLVKNIDGAEIVFDVLTGLMWPRFFNSAGCNFGNVLSWNNALNYAENLVFAGFTDWRMPNIYELITLLDLEKSQSPTIQNCFANFPAGDFWIYSGTTRKLSTDRAWGVNFYNCIIRESLSKTTPYGILCVRGGAL
jgi:hypothetical protein